MNETADAPAPRLVGADGSLPEGYVRVSVHGATVVARADAAAGVRRAVAAGTLYGWASEHPERRELHGRAPVYAVPLPGGPRVVVRHARHGGLLARLTGDRFLAPTRAPAELVTALTLRAHGIRTPAVVAYAVYPAGGPLRRADVATEEIADAADGAAALRTDDAARRRALLDAAAELLAALARHGVHHPDLNLKNVLFTDTGAAPEAWLLDVDRVRRLPDAAPAAVLDRNLARLDRSLRKWSDRYGLPVTAAERRALAEAARRRLA